MLSCTLTLLPAGKEGKEKALAAQTGLLEASDCLVSKWLQAAVAKLAPGSALMLSVIEAAVRA